MFIVNRFVLVALVLSAFANARHQNKYKSYASYSGLGFANGLPTSSCLPKASITALASVPTTEYSSDDRVTVRRTLTEASASATSSEAIHSQFKPRVKWDICIHYPIKHDSVHDLVPAAAKVWEIDLGHAHEFPGMIPMLKKAGKFVICYFNAGAVQTWDDDKIQFPDDSIGKALYYPYSTEEFYVDIRDERVLDVMKARLRSAVQVGCDGVDPDNVDAWVQDGNDPTGFSLKPSDYAMYLKSMAEYAHSLITQHGQPLLVGQKNAPELVEGLVSTLDFAVLEQCRGISEDGEHSYPFCSDFQSYIDARKPVFQIEYPPSISKFDGALSASDKLFYCKVENGDEDFSKILKWASDKLDGWGEYCHGEPFRIAEADYD